MYKREKILRGVDKRWKKQVKTDPKHTGSHMPHKMEMTRKEFDAHKSTLGKSQHRKITRGLPLYRGAKIKVIN